MKYPSDGMDILGGYLLYIMSTLKITTDGRLTMIPIFENSVISLDGLIIAIGDKLKINMDSSPESVNSFLDENGYVGLNSDTEIEVREMVMFSRDLRSGYNTYCMEHKIIPVYKTEFLLIIKSCGFKPEPILRIGGKVSNGFRFYKKKV